MIEITAELSEEQAEALAQFCKRACFSTFHQHAKNTDEAYIMQAAVRAVEKALQDKGYNPR